MSLGSRKSSEKRWRPAIFEPRTKLQSELWEQSCALTGYWQRVESEAQKRSQKIRDTIEIIQLQKKERAMQRIQENARYRPLPKSSALLPLPIVSKAKQLFAGATALSGPQLFDFFANYSDDISRTRYGSDLAAKKEDEDSIRQILGSCSGIAQGRPPKSVSAMHMGGWVKGWSGASHI
jgi:hypothetical protein